MAIDKTQIWTAVISGIIGMLGTLGTQYLTSSNEKSKVLITDKTEQLVKKNDERKKIYNSFMKHIAKQGCYMQYDTMKDEAKSLADRNKEIDALIEEINKLSK